MSSGARGFNYSTLNYPNYNAIMAAPPPPMQQNQSYPPQSNSNSGFSSSEYSNSGYSGSNYNNSGGAGGYSGGSGFSGGYSGGGSGGGYSSGYSGGSGYSGSNSGYGGLNTAAPATGGGYTNRSQLFNSGSLGPPDPVSKPVYHNTMESGSYSKFSQFNKKRPKPLNPIKTMCNVCALTFNSQDQLAAHIRGSKHAKKLQSTEIIGGMKIEEKLKSKAKATLGMLPAGAAAQNASSDKTAKPGSTSFLSCAVCNVMVNSAMQMAAHNIGSKHKNKVQLATGEKKIKLSKDNDKPAATSTPKAASKAPAKAAAKTTTPKTSEPADKPTTTTITTTTTPALTPIERTNGTAEEGSNVKEKKPPPPPKVPKPVIILTCEICGISVNSDAQLSQHKTSKKHLDKLSGKSSKPMKPKLTGANKTNAQFKQAGKKAGLGSFSTPMPPLSQSFVKKDLVYF